MLLKIGICDDEPEYTTILAEPMILTQRKIIHFR